MAYFDFNGKKIYYEIHGEGRPIVLLNGIMMSTLSWKMFVESLSANNKLVLLDFFDQGQSDQYTEEPYNQDLQVKALKALLDHLNLEAPALAGISYGGNVALKFAVTYPDYIDRLLIFNASAKTGDWLKEMGQSWIMSAKDPAHFYNTTIPIIYSKMFYDGKSKWMQERKKFLVDNIFNNKVFLDGIIRLIQSADDYNIEDEMSKITAKTLIVASQYDPITPFSDQKQLHDGIKDSELVILPDCGHATMYENPVLFTTLILGFANSKFEGLKI
ncbi:MAG: alpha/beta hydrolase [Defluviitaleaceae bacterium]|nr:alpha/beta hydrolase [Defluviitaleaceae bacterium]